MCFYSFANIVLFSICLFIKIAASSTYSVRVLNVTSVSKVSVNKFGVIYKSSCMSSNSATVSFLCKFFYFVF